MVTPTVMEGQKRSQARASARRSRAGVLYARGMTEVKPPRKNSFCIPNERLFLVVRLFETRRRPYQLHDAPPQLPVPDAYKRLI